LTGLDESVLQIKTKIVSCHTADSKPVKHEVNGTVILLSLVYPGISIYRDASFAQPILLLPPKIECDILPNTLFKQLVINLLKKQITIAVFLRPSNKTIMLQVRGLVTVFHFLLFNREKKTFLENNIVTLLCVSSNSH
jgi:hypothetical protein